MEIASAAQKPRTRNIGIRMMHGINARSLRLLMLPMFMFAPGARGQASVAPTQTELGKALAKSRGKEALRVRIGTDLFEGQLDAITPDTLRLRTGTGDVVALPARSVRNVWVKRNIRAEATGIGAMMGAILGAGLGTISRNNKCDPLTGCKGNIPLKLVAGTAAGGIAGGVIGAIVGGTRRHWAQIFPD
jgi:hypothetical protein